jgi:nucleotide-binding universal stress UspA family protein
MTGAGEGVKARVRQARRALIGIKVAGDPVCHLGSRLSGETVMGPIIAATDLSARSDRALRRAARIAASTGSELHIVHLMDDELPAALLQRRSDEAEATLNALVAADDDLSAASPKIDVEAGQIRKLLPDLIERRDAGLVVLGTHRNRGLAELVEQPTLTKVMRAATAPILIAVQPAAQDYRTLVAGWDFSPASAAAVALAKTFAPAEALTLVHAWADPLTGAPYAMDLAGSATPARQAGIEAALEEAKASVAADGLTVEMEAMIGAPQRALIEQAEARRADLLVLGRHARSGLARFLLGETAERVAIMAPCDVLIAPPG